MAITEPHGVQLSPSQHEAFERWVVPQIPCMRSLSRRLTSGAADAEDLVQDSLMRAYRGLSRFDGRYPKAWLLTIVRNTHRNRARKRIPEPVPEIGDPRPPVLAGSLDETEALLVGSTLDDSVERAFRRLRPAHREILELIAVHRLSYQEAADALGLPLGTVMSRLHRARAQCRSNLAAESPRLAS
jgi:RNA polymerase sigma-70 factor (ECF subfamily)